MALVDVLLAVSVLNMELMQLKAVFFFFHCQHSKIVEELVLMMILDWCCFDTMNNIQG
jgi:hypothetical protein